MIRRAGPKLNREWMFITSIFVDRSRSNRVISWRWDIARLRWPSKDDRRPASNQNPGTWELCPPLNSRSLDRRESKYSAATNIHDASAVDKIKIFNQKSLVLLLQRVMCKSHHFIVLVPSNKIPTTTITRKPQATVHRESTVPKSINDHRNSHC